MCDGEELGRIGDEPLHIMLASETVTLLHPRDYNYFDLLRSKLNWGRAQPRSALGSALTAMLSLIRIKNYAVDR